MAPVVAIFAHPDDEAFGPAGTLALLSRERDVYLICVTDGSEGINSSDSSRDLADIRKEELIASAKILGIKEVFFLGFKDGSLSNSLYHAVAKKIQPFLEKFQPETVITLENRGVSGHLDHIAVSMITTYLFEKLSFLRELWFFCIDEKHRELFRKYYPDFFISLPEGYKRSAVSEIKDVSSVWEQKVEAMHKHTSQQHDSEKVFAMQDQLPKEELFFIRKK